MKNREFQARVDRSLSALQWDEQRRGQVLRAVEREEQTVKKKLCTALLAAVILCLSLSALAAAGLIFAPRVDAGRIADQALEAQYGITLEMQDYFDRTSVEQSDGSVVFTYVGQYEFHYVLGEYTVTVKDGEAIAAWSRDGADTAGGLDADAWGAEQLAAMLAESRQTRSSAPFSDRARDIAAAHGAQTNDPVYHDPDGQRGLAEVDVEALLPLAKDAIRQVYGLTDAQLAELSYVEEMSGLLPDDRGERRILHMNLQLWQDHHPDSHGITPFVEKDGMYDVFIHLDTQVIEDIAYQSGLAGNG